MLKLILGLALIGGGGYFLYQHLEKNAPETEIKQIPKSEQQKNREKRNPYFQ